MRDYINEYTGERYNMNLTILSHRNSVNRVFVQINTQFGGAWWAIEDGRISGVHTRAFSARQ